MVCWDGSEVIVSARIEEQQGAQHTVEAHSHVLEATSAIEEQQGVHVQHTVDHAELHEPHPQTTSSTAGFISNIFFLFGSILYVGLAVWDYQDAEKGSNDDGGPSLLAHDADELLEHETDEVRMKIDFPSFTIAISTYTAISVSAALMYVFDAIFQIKAVMNSRSGNSNHHLLHRLRHIPLLETSTGLAFGVGAMLDFICTMTRNLVQDPRISRYFGVSSSYTFLLSAFLVSVGNEFLCFDTITDGMESSGDILFIIGSIIDVLSSYLLAGKDAHAVAVGGLVSTNLWLMDAIIYILADFSYLLAGCCCFGGAPAEDDDSSEEGQDNAISVALCSAASELHCQEDDAALSCLDLCSSTTTTSDTARNDE